MIGVPVHVSIVGVTFIKEVRGPPPFCVPNALNGAILPVPVEVKPIKVSVFIHVNKVDEVPEKFSELKVAS